LKPARSLYCTALLPPRLPGVVNNAACCPAAAAAAAAAAVTLLVGSTRGSWRATACLGTLQHSQVSNASLHSSH
jgi:hypothetical protein